MSYDGILFLAAWDGIFLTFFYGVMEIFCLQEIEYTGIMIKWAAIKRWLKSWAVKDILGVMDEYSLAVKREDNLMVIFRYSHFFFNSDHF